MDEARIGQPMTQMVGRASHCARSAVSLLVLLAFLCAAQSVSPAGQALRPNQVTPREDSRFGGSSDQSPVETERRMRALNAERQKAMVSDTDKLLELARQLDAEVAASNSDVLTTGQLRKIAAIEKLAHNVKQKMNLSFESGPEFRETIPPALSPGAPSHGPG